MHKKVPVVLFAFNRPKQLKQTLDCLRNNNIDLLYIFIDGPRGDPDKRGIGEVGAIVKEIKWTKVVIKKRKINLGLSRSIQEGIDEVFKRHTSAIIVEDDVCVSPDFYNYMKTCLNTYKNNKNVAGVTGLRYPFDRKYLDNTSSDVFLAPRFSSWGWATWKDRWDKIVFNPKKLLLDLETKGVSFIKGGEDLEPSYWAIKQGTLTGCWDIYFYINMILNDQYFVWPKYNMVENIDIGGGSHFSNEKPSWLLEWEKNTEYKKISKDIDFDVNIYRDFLKFFEYNKKTKRSINQEMKSNIKKALAKLGVDIKKVPKGVNPENIDPTDYTTTDSPQEVPCQKETYFYALNNYVKEGDKVLDVGMGVGYGMNLLSIKAKEVYAVDVDEKAVQACTQNVLGKNPKVKELKLYDGYKLPYKDNYFDIVTCVDVVEHVEDYDKFIDELLRVAKRAVVFGTPNRRPEYTNPDGTPTNYWHLREWSFKEFDKIAKKHSKKVEWTFLDGPWQGPFKISHKVNKDTQVLLPALIK